ncbi:MAG: creatininase family protein [Pyramidobacter sp.]|uniref:creatininase family protein n=1 Tax=Pyramidobacter sp. TaxID=1943581 RepID=UPI002A7F7679|nr:creatininase family protein [Pyramidobacter sp.]MDY4031599.1 creatininase family protein [Pyramidobacter sp.]
MYLASMTWREFHEAASDDLLALVPLGSTEQHGSIGPLGTDFTIPEEMARRLEARYADRLVVLPTMPYGVCPYHTEFSGTIDIGTAALQSVMTSVAERLMDAGVRRFAFLNGHGGNDPALEAACLRIYGRGGLGAILDWWTIARELDPRWGGGHGGGQEAAVMMALRPDWVRKEKNFVPEEIRSLTPELKSTYGNAIAFKGATVKIIRSTAAFTKTGTFGGGDDSCAKADAAWGREIFEGTVRYLGDFVEEFLKAPLPAAKC